jgi:hypothetical protein
MKRWFLLFILAFGACAPGDRSPTTPTLSPDVVVGPSRPPVYALIHLWYKPAPQSCPTVGHPRVAWGQWVWSQKMDDPCRIIPGTLWLREISSGVYPLTGPYNSSHEDVMRWQIRQAKAAGIDGFLISLYSWEPHLRYLRDLFFGNEVQGIKCMLRIAPEEGFKIGIEGWGLPDEEDRARQIQSWKDEVGWHLAAIAASPYRSAYITIDGRPVYWCFFHDWMSEAERLEFFDGTAADPRQVTWILRNGSVDAVAALNRRLKNSRAQYVTWTGVPEVNGWRLNANFASELTRTASLANLGMIPISHAYTGYDERHGVPERPYTGRYGLRDGDAYITNFLERSATSGARLILMESFNEWGEGSQLEAGLNIEAYRDMGQERGLYLDSNGVDDPYRYLKIIARFKGKEWVPPVLPCSIMDPIMHLRISNNPELRCR